MKTHLPPAKYYDSDNDIMMSPTSLVFIIFYPPLIVSFHLAAVNTSMSIELPALSIALRALISKSKLFLLSDVSVVGGDGGGGGLEARRRHQQQQQQYSSHYDDFIEFDLINNDNADEPTTNENKNTWASRSQSSSLFPRLHEILESSPISYSASITNNLMQQLSAAGFVDDNDITQFGKGVHCTGRGVVSDINS